MREEPYSLDYRDLNDDTLRALGENPFIVQSMTDEQKRDLLKNPNLTNKQREMLFR